MADKDDVNSEEQKPSPLPLIIGGLVVAAIIAVIVIKNRRRPKPVATLPPVPKADPCEGLTEWACAAVSLLNPLAKTSVDIFKAQGEADLQRARLRA